ncbi:ion channel [Profundibacterium mesophilum]|uniref:Potassium channel protein n=1 Tax=Profundibacterium mesophilum KAUST100406-0324 TaxID=1037889 RepID=A0A921NUY2_9RHOB|nr:ion channel [Profundibacterium mesophilum]KAF0676068.1 Potassium channel protein [Profundibacterium mesophilum KAUST100406-0324]
MNFYNKMPGGFARLARKMLQDLARLSWRAALVLTTLHVSISYVGLFLLGETELTQNWARYLYFYVVTGSTVGYGDLSPGTRWGAIFTALFVVPGAIAIFASFLLGRVFIAIQEGVQTIMNGLGDFTDRYGHVVIVGYIPGDTERLLRETRMHHAGKDVIVIAAGANAPRGRSAFTSVHANSLSSLRDLERAGIKGAAHVVIMPGNDDECLAAGLAVGALEPKGHVVAYFEDREKAQLLDHHVAQIECVSSTSVELVSRAMVDPGASAVLADLSSASRNATLHSMQIRPGGSAATDLQGWIRRLRKRGATLIALRRPGETETVSFDLSDPIADLTGYTLYYIAAKRLPRN